MASNFKLSDSARNAAADGIVDLIDGGSGPGEIDIRTGSPPADPGEADSGTLLGTCTHGDPAFGDAASGTATANAISSDSDADASGDAGHFRTKDSNDNVIYQGTAGEAADSPDLEFDNKSIVSGGTIAISAWTVTMPEGP